jgi:hypothetical protein
MKKKWKKISRKGAGWIFPFSLSVVPVPELNGNLLINLHFSLSPFSKSRPPHESSHQAVP